MLQLYLRYYPSQGHTQFIGDLFLGGTSRSCSRLIAILNEVKSSKKIMMEIKDVTGRKDPLLELKNMDFERFNFLEWRYYEGIDRLKFERKKNKLIIHVNPYTLAELMNCLEKLKKDSVDYGMDAFELIFEDSQVKRSNRRLWFVRV